MLDRNSHIRGGSEAEDISANSILYKQWPNDVCKALGSVKDPESVANDANMSINSIFRYSIRIIIGLYLAHIADKSRVRYATTAPIFC